MTRNILHVVDPPTCGITDLAPGDLVVTGPVSWRSSPLGWAIGHTVSAATWPWEFGPNALRACHMGICAPYGRRLLAFYESTIDEGLGACIDDGDDVKGVQVHLLDRRLHLHLDDRGGRAWRLPHFTWLGVECFERRLESTCTARLTVPYDLWGAFCARTFGLGWTRRFRPARTDANRKFYCNEFCLCVYKAMGWLPDDVVPSKENPKSTVALLVKHGICGPPEEIKL